MITRDFYMRMMEDDEGKYGGNLLSPPYFFNLTP